MCGRPSGSPSGIDRPDGFGPRTLYGVVELRVKAISGHRYDPRY
jgi:hypothetical protein